MHGTNSRHGGALLELHTGSDTFVRPSMGSWVTYGLGTENQNLPGFITICPTLAHGGVNNWSSAFLPAVYQGTPLGNASVPSDQARDPVHRERRDAARDLQRLQLDLLQRDEPRAPGRRPGPTRRSKAASTRSSWPSACRPTLPEVQDISGEIAGDAQALRPRRPGDRELRPAVPAGPALRRARRALRAGARTATSGTSTANLKTRPRAERPAKSTSRSPACCTDLKARGLLEDTLVLWGGEFGRTPTAQGDDGRDHNPHGFTMWLAGGGVKPGLALRRDRRLRLLRRREQGPHPRPARHDPAPAGPRPRAADLPLRRPRLPPDRRARRSRARHRGLKRRPANLASYLTTGRT